MHVHVLMLMYKIVLMFVSVDKQGESNTAWLFVFVGTEEMNSSERASRGSQASLSLLLVCTTIAILNRSCLVSPNLLFRYLFAIRKQNYLRGK